MAITKEMLIGDIVATYPEVIPTLTGLGVHCVGCHVSPFESLEMGFKGHGMDDKTIKSAVLQLNKAIQKKIPEKKESIQQVNILLSDAASKKIKELIKKEKKQALRLAIKPGGCSGYSYTITLEKAAKKNDFVLKQKGVTLYVDKASAPQLHGSSLDYLDGLTGAGFKVINPNAVSTCGCGSSFS